MRKTIHTSLLGLVAATALAAPQGPVPQVPDGGQMPGAFPNTSVSGINVIARGSTEFNSNVEIAAIEGQGPIPWSINRYNRGDVALRLAPANPTAALSSINLGFIEYSEMATSTAAHHAWRPSPLFGVIIPTARQNGPINWNDGEPAFFPTIAIAESASAPGFAMNTGAYGTGDLDINTGSAGAPGSSPEANFAFSATWFPYDQGWLGGEIGTPMADTGAAQWTRPGAHSAGLTPGVMTWRDLGGIFGGIGQLTIPGVNSVTNGMLFATSSDGGSDVNILGVAPAESGLGWTITIREDSATDATTFADGGQSEFQFVYVPYTAANLIGGHINGTTGAKVQSQGDFTITRTSAGTYEMTIPNKGATNGTLLLQVADFEAGTAGTSEPIASRAFLSYQVVNGKFVIQSRVTSSDTDAALTDANFYVAWVDFTTPLAPPAGPRLRVNGPVVVSEGLTAPTHGNVAANTDLPELLVTTIDTLNEGGHNDPISGQPAAQALVGYFVDPVTLTNIRGPFVILGNPAGDLNRNDVKYNPVSKQYVVVANARTYGANQKGVPMIALVNNNTVAGEASPVAKAFAYDENTEISYDDVAIAVSTANGNILLAAEYQVVGEGEAAVGVLFDKAGTLLTPASARLDKLQPSGDEDDPDAIYLPGKNAFLYISNTDMAGGLANRVTGAIVQTVPDSTGNLQVSAEQPLGVTRESGAQGHPDAAENPFTGEILTAFDVGGNGVNRGDLSFYNVGAAPSYTFTEARPQIPYLTGYAVSEEAPKAPFEHNHPRIAIDADSGVIAIGHKAGASQLGYPDAYVVSLYDSTGAPLPSQMETPYFVAGAPGNIANGPNLHNIIHSPATDSFITVFTTGGDAPATYLASLEITSDHLPSTGSPTLSVALTGSTLTISWPSAGSDGFVLEATGSLTNPTWATSNAAVTDQNGVKQVTVNASNGMQFFRLRRG